MQEPVQTILPSCPGQPQCLHIESWLGQVWNYLLGFVIVRQPDKPSNIFLLILQDWYCLLITNPTAAKILPSNTGIKKASVKLWRPLKDGTRRVVGTWILLACGKIAWHRPLKLVLVFPLTNNRFNICRRSSTWRLLENRPVPFAGNLYTEFLLFSKNASGERT
jgi:hypothetical protein